MLIFLIPALDKVTVQLYEYAGNNPVKAYRKDEYKVLLQNNVGERYTLNAVNYSDRLVFGPLHSKKIIDAFMFGGAVKFKIIDLDTPTTIYEFTIDNTDGFSSVVEKFQE